MFVRMRTIRLVAAWAFGLLIFAGCASGFRPQTYGTGEELFAASMDRFERRKWGDAAAGFERLTFELSPQDSTLRLSHYYLGVARQRNGEHLLAAQALTRMAQSFPGDTLAARALFLAADSYSRLWRKPQLDPEYGDAAMDTYRTLLSDYPQSTLADSARMALSVLREKQALKDFEVGQDYMRRRFRDSAILYFRDVVERYPETDVARRAYLRMLDAYRAIGYDEEAAEVCSTLRERNPTDADVIDACGSVAAAGALPDSST